ncbi:Rossmann-like domain-containing protein [Tenuifilum thalassicum]|uniref:Putative heavy-metal chelation domain-containing protein n=1 Tax=Tenuifilum thalassicum TaxID=2590900 RepID=A0A7D4BE77_9BACT|nr:DUF364 domain-containing protein [Tenuifilum thalassicum]QKG80443.1 hypothetical protein FHG85_09250 [Tenuifilum thalassicum]
MNTKLDILEKLFAKANQQIPYKDITFTLGDKYVAAQCPDGNIGVCATLGTKVREQNSDGITFESQNNRILANAYVNSVLNYRVKFDGTGDIFNAVEFKDFNNVVMIGYFGSLVEKLKSKGVSPYVFDIDQHEAPVLPMEVQAKYLSHADCIILTSTSISNNTFYGIVKSTPEHCSIFMLGPSTPLDDFMFSIPKIKGLFGSIFPNNNTETLHLIAQGVGTRGFMHNMQKVFRLK